MSKKSLKNIINSKEARKYLERIENIEILQELYKVKKDKNNLNIIIKNIPLNPKFINLVILSVAPSNTIEYDNKFVSENLYPLWNTFCPKNKFPTSIPKNIATVPAPKLGTNLDNPILTNAIIIDTINPGSISFTTPKIFFFLIIINAPSNKIKAIPFNMALINGSIVKSIPAIVPVVLRGK